MRTKIVEAVQSKDRPGNWGKFLVGVFDEEWAYDSRVHPDGAPLLRSCGWWGPERVWVLDLQTGEGAYFNPGGMARADLEKHAVWVCPLYEPFLEWLYARHRENGGRLDLDGLPDVVELPGAEFAFSGFRRPGPPDFVRGLAETPDDVLALAVEALGPEKRERLSRALGAVAS